MEEKNAMAAENVFISNILVEISARSLVHWVTHLDSTTVDQVIEVMKLEGEFNPVFSFLFSMLVCNETMDECYIPEGQLCGGNHTSALSTLPLTFILFSLCSFLHLSFI